MPRPYRVFYPGATYHVHARGNRRGAIFYEDRDYLHYLALLEQVRSTHPFDLHSYCLMTNHLHLQIEISHTPLSQIIKELHSRYAVYFNRKYDYDGHLFQGRYGAKVIESIDYFLGVSRYIHRNPLEACMVGDMANYEWSSYPSYICRKENPHINTKRTLSYFNEPAHEQYRLYTESENKNADELIWVPR
jgi:putative transposase